MCRDTHYLFQKVQGYEVIAHVGSKQTLHVGDLSLLGVHVFMWENRSITHMESMLNCIAASYRRARQASRVENHVPSFG